MRLLILGTGGMANAHAEQFSKIEGVEIVAGAEPDATRLNDFLTRHGIGHGFASLEEALAWGRFDAVANVTPDRVHHPTTMAAIAAGKHVFCEKPLATDATRAVEMADAIEAAGLVGMVNLTYRNSPAIQAGRRLVQQGAIGALRQFEATHLQSWLVGNHWGDWRTEQRFLWRLSTAHGSNGALGDIGIHIVDFASYGADQDVSSVSARLQTFPKIDGDSIGEYRFDANDGFAMTIELDNGAIGTIQASRTAAGQQDQLRLRLYGETGSLEILFDTGTSTLRGCLVEDVHTATWRDLETEPVETNYQRFARAVRDGETLEPSFRRAAGIQRVLDAAQHADRTGTRVVLSDHPE